MSKKIVVAGSIAMDRIMNFSGNYADIIHPNKLDVLSVSVLVDSVKDAPGGTGANIAYNLAILGEKPVLIGAVGPDAEQYMSDLNALGIDISHVHKSKLSTASFMVLTDRNNNQVGGFYPGADFDSGSMSFSPWFDEADNLVVCVAAQFPETMRRLVQESVDHKLELFYDPGQQVTSAPAEDLKAGALAAQILIVNSYELGALAKKTGLSEAELKDTVPVLITTLGKDGSLISGKSLSEDIKIPAASPSEIVDPTGAGDAYRSGFLYGYLRQWNLDDCGRLGTVLASFVVEQSGTQLEISREAITKRYQATFNKDVNL